MKYLSQVHISLRRDLQLREDKIASCPLYQGPLWLIMVFGETKQRMTSQDFLESSQLLIKEAISVVSVWQWVSDWVPSGVRLYSWYNSEINLMALAGA